MKIKELFEGLSNTLFYARGINSALEIVKTNEIRLSPTFTKSVEKNDNHNYYLSTSRTRTGKYHVDNSSYHVLFELDGRLLSNNFTGEPIDYWGDSFRKASGGAYEQEDRLYSNKPSIKNAMKYIKRVDILVDAKRNHEQTNKNIKTMVLKLKTNGIPVRIYTDNRSWVSGGLSQMSLDDFLSLNFPEVKKISREQTEEDTYQNMRAVLRAKPKSDIGLIYKALVVDDVNAFTPEESHKLRRYTSFLDAKSTVSAELHNAQNDSSLRETLNKIGLFMRKNKIREPRELADFLVNKWGR
jgi:hypothetical protein